MYNKSVVNGDINEIDVMFFFFFFFKGKIDVVLITICHLFYYQIDCSLLYHYLLYSSSFFHQ